MVKTLSKKIQGSWERTDIASITALKKTGALDFRIFQQWALGKTSSAQYRHSAQILFKSWLDIRNKAYLSSSESYLDIDERVETTSSEEVSKELKIDCEALLRPWTVLLNSPRSLPQRKMYCKIYENLTAKLKDAPASEPDLGRRVLQEFEQYARRIVATNNIKLVSTSIREWTSIEDQTWKQLILDFAVDSKPEIALVLWDNLSDELSTFIDSRYGQESTKLHEILSVTVRWK